MSNDYTANTVSTTTQASGGTNLQTSIDKVLSSLDSLFTNNSGVSAPTYTQPYNTWIDTTTHVQYRITPTGSLSVINANFADSNLTRLSTSTALTVSSHGHIVLVDCSSGSVTVTLPTLTPTTGVGYKVSIKKVDATANTLIISSPSSIDDGAQVVLREKDDAVEILFTYPNFHISSSNIKPLAVVKDDATASYSVIPSDNTKVITVSNTSASAFNLPACANLANGFTVTIKKLSAAALDITIMPDAVDLIEGIGTLVLSTQNEYVTLVNDNVSNWRIINKG